MKKILLFIILAISCGVVAAQKVERVSPIYGEDDQANKMISYISDNLRLVIPSGRSLDDIQGVLRCKISIDPTGKICSIETMNNNMMPTWLEVVIIEGLKAIPPSPLWRSPATHELRKALVFTFGRGGKYQQKMYGLNTGQINRNIDAAVDKWQKHMQDSLAKHWSKWEEKAKADLKMPMPMTPDKSRPKAPDLKTPPITPPVNLPKVEISIE